jgi:hypothetical protein
MRTIVAIVKKQEEDEEEGGGEMARLRGTRAGKGCSKRGAASAL